MPKISQLTSAATIVGTEELPIVQSTTTKKVTAESLLTKPIFQIDLTSAQYDIVQYGIYYITVGSQGLDPFYITLPDPIENAGMEVTIFNYDQVNNADIKGTNIPNLEASTDSNDKYDTILAKSAVKLIAINGYWSALNYRD